MKRSKLLSVLLGLLLMSFAATDAMAMMNPTTGRFIQADPLGYPDGMNRYGAYHVMHGGVDPSGLSTAVGSQGRNRNVGSTPQLQDYDKNGKINDRDREIQEIGETIGWIDSWRVSHVPEKAYQATANDPGSWGGNADALRHCIWMCMTARIIGKKEALEMGDIHEKWSPAPDRFNKDCDCPKGYKTVDDWKKDDRAMDEHNNKVGAEFGSSRCRETDSRGRPTGKDCSCEGFCRRALASGKLKVNSPPDGYACP